MKQNCFYAGPQMGDAITRTLSGVKFVAIILSLMLILLNHARAVDESRDYAVLASATTQTFPPQITLSWPQDMFAVPTSYTVSRKSPDTNVWSMLGTLSGSETSFTDTNVVANAEYEYQIAKSAVGYMGYGYVLAGIEVPLVESRGKVLLIVDNTWTTALAMELARLEQDLIGDGWSVVRHDVNRTDSPVSVKALILADYAADPANVRSVFLFGHVPVPYSGDIAPDGHPDHRGAWPSDVFYGDLDGDWTDFSVRNTNAASPRNCNEPGDGKFDQSSARVELEVGRVDLANLPSFALPEGELLRRYLNKDHNFRHKVVTASPKGFVCDNFGPFNGAAFAATGWRNFSGFFGASNIVATGSWFSSLASSSYLWAYGCGGGTFNSIAGIGTTADFAANDPMVVFTFLFGSYFGDWDSIDNVMRAAIATPTYTLTSAWGGRPHWFVHHMALGETIGYSTRLSQNNANSTPVYRPVAAGTQQIHVGLMGDPTLRLHIVAPPTDAIATPGAGQVTLSWTSSVDTVLGYFIYRATNFQGPFTRVSDSLITELSYVDSGLDAGSYVYQVRAIRLETSASGSYYNASQAAFATGQVNSSALRLAGAPDQSVEVGAAWRFETPTATGGCGSATVEMLSTTTNATCGNCLVATRVWQARDACGNMAFTTNIVTVVDTVAPLITSLPSKTVTTGTAWTFDTPVANDEGSETIIIVAGTLTNGSTITRTWNISDLCGNTTPCSQTVTIAAAVPPTVTITASDANASEANSDKGIFIVQRTGDRTASLTVNLGYTGTAINGVDYHTLATQVVIPSGSDSITFDLIPVSDKVNEKNETVTATLQVSSVYLVGNRSKATITITNAGASKGNSK